MLLNELDGHVKTNIGDIKQYHIAADAVIFKMLSSDIYSDKIRAVIRELSTNAYDAMVEYGTIKLDDLESSQRFKVHLPTYLEPFFSIRDFGPGLDEEGIVYVYTYGASTRRKSNNFAGVLGIGAKSPHAYSKSGFNINSYHNGTLYSYVSFLKDGEPSYVLNDASPTTEPNGVEVIINVSQNDIDSFRRKARDVYFWFKHKPEFNIEMDFSYYDVTEDSDYYSIVRSNVRNTSSYSSGSYAYGVLMGNILYSYPEILLKEFKDREARILQKAVFKADIGEVDFHPSREYLDASEKTKKFLKEKMRNLVKAIENNINAKIETIYKDPSLSYFQKAGKMFSSVKLFNSILEFDDLKSLAIKTYPRLKIIEDRISNIKKRLPWVERITYRNVYKDISETSSSVNLTDTIVIADRPLSYDAINKWLVEKNVTNRRDLKIIFPKYSFFPKLSNGRYDYEHIHSVVKKDILALFRCKEDEVYFTSLMHKPVAAVIRSPRLKKNDPKIAKVRYIDFNKRHWENIRSPYLQEEFDIRNPPNKIHYIRVKNLKTNTIELGDGKEMKWLINEEDFFIQLKNYLSKFSISNEIGHRLFIAHPSILNDKTLEHENYVDIIKLIKEKTSPIERIDSSAVIGFKSLFLPYYTSEQERFLQDPNPHKSELFKLIKGDQKFCERLLSTNVTGTDYNKLGALVTYDFIILQPPSWFDDYKAKYPGLIDVFSQYTSRYRDYDKTDLLLYILEAAKESGKI